MGGLGSGRPRTNRLTTEAYCLDVRELARYGTLESRFMRIRLAHSRGSTLVHCRSEPDRLHLEFHCGRDLFGERKHSLTLKLLWTDCSLGGKRPWWVCPGANCGQPVSILYGQEHFVCRRCRHVTYPMQRVAPQSRDLARAQLLRMRLGGSPDVTGPFPPKPKGMHQWTYARKGTAILAAERKASERFLDRVGRPVSKPDTAPSLAQELEGLF